MKDIKFHVNHPFTLVELSEPNETIGALHIAECEGTFNRGNYIAEWCEISEHYMVSQINNGEVGPLLHISLDEEQIRLLESKNHITVLA